MGDWRSSVRDSPVPTQQPENESRGPPWRASLQATGDRSLPPRPVLVGAAVDRPCRGGVCRNHSVVEAHSGATKTEYGDYWKNHHCVFFSFYRPLFQLLIARSRSPDRLGKASREGRRTRSSTRSCSRRSRKWTPLVHSIQASCGRPRLSVTCYLEGAPSPTSSRISAPRRPSHLSQVKTE
jgi:hypothetical protein